MTRQKNITIQLHNRIDSLLAIGESKHNMKEVYRKSCEEQGVKWNPSKTPFIHSIKTADAYRQTVGEFSKWLKLDQNDVWSTKDLSKVGKEVAYSYLQHREKEGCSAYTISKDMSALNKVLDLGLSKAEGGLAGRSIDNITRSRTDKAHDGQYNPDNYKDQIELASAFGLRRESIYGGDYAVKDISIFTNEGNTYCSVVEKGGRYRESPCLEEYKDSINAKYGPEERDFGSKAEFEVIYATSEDMLFDAYTNKIDNHAFRGDYAKSLYEQLEAEKDIVNSDFRGYDKELIIQVSEALGHSRPNVVVEHYM